MWVYEHHVRSILSNQFRVSLPKENFLWDFHFFEISFVILYLCHILIGIYTVTKRFLTCQVLLVGYILMGLGLAMGWIYYLQGIWIWICVTGAIITFVDGIWLIRRIGSHLASFSLRPLQGGLGVGF